MKKVRDYLLEGVLIVFSVLFALFIDNYTESVKTQKQKELAIRRIKMELEKNSVTLAEWIPHHEEIFQRLNTLVLNENDSLKKTLLAYKPQFWNFNK